MAGDPFAAFADPVSEDEFAAIAEPQRPVDTHDYFDADQKAAWARLSPEQQAAWDAGQLNVPGLPLNAEVGSDAPVLDQDLGRRLYMGVGDVVQGIAEIPGLLANPINAALNWTGIPQALLGEPLGTDLGQAARDASGAPAPVTDSERMASMINRGGAGAVASAGAALPLQAAGGTAGAVARTIAENPVRDLIAGMAGGAGAEYGGDAGEAVGGFVGGEGGAQAGRTAGSIVGGLAGGIGGVAAHRRAEQMAEAIVDRFPRSVLFDGTGNLTEEGLEIAHRTGADPEAIVTAARLRPRSRTSREPLPGTPQDREALLNAETARLTDAIAERAARPTPADPGAPPPSGGAAAGGAGDQPPRSVFQEAREEGIPLSRGQAEQDFAIQNDENSLRVAASREGNVARQWFQAQAEAIKDAVTRFRRSIGNDPGGAAERGQVLKDAIRDLRDAGREGVRALYREAEALGGQGLRLPTQGIRDAATDVLIDEAVPEGVKRAVSQELARYGIIGSDAVTNEAGITRVALDDGSTVSFRGPVKELTASNAEDLRRAINRLYDPTKPNLSGQSIKPAIDDALEEALNSAASRGGNSPLRRVGEQSDGTVEFVLETGSESIPVKVRPHTGGQYAEVSIDEENLTAANRIGPAKVRELISHIKEAFPNVRVLHGVRISGANPNRNAGINVDSIKPATSGREREIGAAYSRARDAHRTQKATFEAKDIIENLIAAKKGTQTDVVLPERAIAQVLGNGPDGVTNLRRVRNLLLTRPTASSRQAWAAIKHQALADIFDTALARNTNTGGEITDAISGAKLRRAIFDQFGADKLRIILDPQEYSQLMKLQRIIGHATIPMTGTTNPSGTFTKMVNFLKAGTLRMAAVTPGVNMAVDATGNLLAKARDLSATRKTLEGITSYDGPDSGRRMDQRAQDFVRQYIQDGKAGRLMPASVSLGSSQSGSTSN